MAISLGLLNGAREQNAQIINSDELTTNIPDDEALDLMLALQHGLTELHLANNPELPVGEGRFGKLIPQAMQVFFKAWGGNGE